MILIDGVVGCGKTTLGKQLAKYMDIPLYEELQKDYTMNLLERFYADKKRWAFTLQIHFLNERFRMIKEISESGELAFLDRSIFGDRIFASMLNEDGFMTDEEYETYSTLLDNMLEHVSKPQKLVYIHCDVDTAVERIQLRGRGMEQSTPVHYWKRLNEKYNEWYEKYDLSEKVVIDARSYNPFKEEDILKVIEKINIQMPV
ncbi:MAG: deoxynucleoside kinase [Brumimicrobium sp.]|nr:deoxynucleoside kinase [Brumimicrobium sp.]